MRNVRNVIFALTVATALLVALGACVLQTPPVPEGPAGAGGSVIRDFNVPGVLTARQANFPGGMSAGAVSVSSLNVQGDMTLGADSLPFYYPMVLSGNITESFTFTDTIAAALLPNDVTVGGMDFFSRAISNTVECNVLYTTAGITPTMNTIAITSTVLTAGEVMTSSVDNAALGAGYLVEFVCNTDADGYARDVMVTLWLK